MRRRASLRRRVAFAFAGFGAAVSLLLAIALYVSAHDVGQRLIDETLRAELDDYMARRSRNPHSLPPATLSLRGYVSAPGESGYEPPAPVRDLPPGRHEIRLDDSPYRVAVAERDGARYFMLFNETRQQVRERRFLAYLAASVLFMTLLAAAGGLWLARRVIAPVTELARQVGGAEPDAPPQLVAEDAPDDEVGELARVFDRYLQRLRAFVERERAFTADVSHELRTPLAVIQGAVEVLHEDPALSAGQSVRLDRIERAAVDMAELIRALLLLAREKSDETQAEERCNAAEVLRECIDKHRHLVESRRTEIALESCSGPGTFRGTHAAGGGGGQSDSQCLRLHRVGQGIDPAGCGPSDGGGHRRRHPRRGSGPRFPALLQGFGEPGQRHRAVAGEAHLRSLRLGDRHRKPRGRGNLGAPRVRPGSVLT